MFVHFVFLVYLISVLVGVGLLVFLWPRLRGSKGSRELFWLYGLCGLFMVAGGAYLYVHANIIVHRSVTLGFMLAAFSIVGAFTYWIPRFHAVRANYHLPRKHEYLFIAGAATGPIAGLAAAFGSGWTALLLTGVPLLVLLVAIGYGCVLSRRSNAKPLRFQLLLPFSAVALGAAEGVFWGDYVWQQGISLGLPLIYCTTNAYLWLHRERILDRSAEGPFDSRRASAVLNWAALTPKEKDVVRAVRQGLTNKQIAQELDVSPSTVKNHLHNIFKKLNVNNRTALFAQVVSGNPKVEL